MFDDIEKIEGAAPEQQKPNHNSWKYMNWIQRSGVIGAGALFVVSLPLGNSHTTPAMVVGVCAWSSLLFGYVAGSLWKVRHALHFWYSMAFACVVHVCVLPIYWRLTRGSLQLNSTGKAYGYFCIFLVCVETIFLVFMLRRFALWLHRRQHAKAGRIGGATYVGDNYVK